MMRKNSTLRRTVLVLVILLLAGVTAWAVDSTQVVSQAADSVQTAVDSTASVQPDSASATSLRGAIGESRPEIKWSISVGKVFWALVVFGIIWIVLHYLTRLLETIAERRTNWRLGIKAAIPIVRIGTWTAVLYLIIARIFAPPIETLLALTASAGIAVGFAAQDILKNIFGGITILFDHPFQVGDKIQVKEHYGEVVSIGLRTVRIVTPDDSLVSIPNAELVNQSVSNANAGENNCQVVAEFYLPPDVDVERVKAIAYRAAAVSRYVYLKKPIAVVMKNVIEEGRSLYKLRLKAYVLDLRYEFPFQSDMTEVFLATLLEEGLVTADQLTGIST
ncbi:mechanosensitive ion channel family protein [bacterium]|nr:mechanosensitive ion channel family protein [bacterium]